MAEGIREKLRILIIQGRKLRQLIIGKLQTPTIGKLQQPILTILGKESRQPSQRILGRQNQILGKGNKEG